MLSVEPSAIIIQPKTTLRTLPAPSDVVFPGLYAWSPVSSAAVTAAIGVDPGGWNTWRNRRLTPAPMPTAWFRRTAGTPLVYKVADILTWLAAKRGERLDPLTTWRQSLDTLYTHPITDLAEVGKHARRWAELAGPRPPGGVAFTPAGFRDYLSSLSSV